MGSAGDNEVLERDRLHGVLELFERLRERPPRRVREHLRPLLLLLGSGNQTTRVAKLFEERCQDERAPFSQIAARAQATDNSGVLREAMHELSHSNSHPRWEPPLRFKYLEMALWLRDLCEIRREAWRAEEGDGEGEPEPPRSSDSAVERENRQLVRALTHPPVGDTPAVPEPGGAGLPQLRAGGDRSPAGRGARARRDDRPAAGGGLPDRPAA